MKILSKFPGIIAILAVIVLGFAACDNGSTSDSPTPTPPVKVTPAEGDFTINVTGMYEVGDTIVVDIESNNGKLSGKITVWYTGTAGTDYGPSETAPVDAGKYIVTFDVAAAGDFNAISGLYAGTFTIYPPIDVTLSTPKSDDFTFPGIESQEFDGSAKAVTITVQNSDFAGAEITVWYTGTAGTDYGPSTTAPVNAGTYIVTFDVAAVPGHSNARIGLIAGTLIINPPHDETLLDPTADDFETNGLGSFEYNGDPKAVTITAVNSDFADAKIIVYYNGSQIAPSAVGTYTVTFEVAAVPGVSNAAELEAGTLTITAVVGPVLETPAFADFDITGLGTYESGDPIAVSVIAKQGKTTGNITIWYTGAEGKTYAKNETAPVDAGTYTVTFDVEAVPGLFNAVTLTAGTITINHGQTPPPEDATPKAADYNYTGIGTFTYDGSPKVVTITEQTGKSTGARTIYYEGTSGTSYGPNTTAPVNAGTYVVTFDVAAATGFKAVTGLSAGTLKINPATPKAADYNISGYGTFTYNGNPRAVTITEQAGKSTGARTINYTGTSGTTYGPSATAPSNAGTYAVTFNVAAAGNYGAATGLPAGTITINKLPAPAATDFNVSGLMQPYNGKPKPVTVTAKPGVTAGAITVWYTGAEGTTYAKSTAKPSAKGTYTVSFDVAAGSVNHNAAIGLSAGTLKIVDISEMGPALVGLVFGNEELKLVTDIENNYVYFGQPMTVIVEGEYDNYYWIFNGYYAGDWEDVNKFSLFIEYNYIDYGAYPGGVYTLRAYAAKDGVWYSNEYTFMVGN